MTETILFEVLDLDHWNLFVIWCLELGAFISLPLDCLDTPLADGEMFWIMAYAHIIIPAPLALFSICSEYFRPHLFFILRWMKGNRGDNKD